MTDEYQIITLSTHLPFVNDAMYIILTVLLFNIIAIARLEIGME